MSTPSKIAVETYFHVRRGTKITSVLLLADEEDFCTLLPNLVSLLSNGKGEPENTYSCIPNLTGQVRSEKAKKRVNINVNDSYRQRLSHCPSLN